jgi:hypothetical protein
VDTLNGLQDGQLVSEARPGCDCEINTLDAPNSLVPISYAGSAPGTVAGVFQINFQVVDNEVYYLNAGGNVGGFSIFTSQ